MINIPKGTKDALPSETYKWHYVEGVAKKLASLYGVKEIRTPIFENTDLFLRSVGETTDIVNKEMYTFEDKGGRSMTLKPEGTAGVARSYIENGLSNTALPLKMYYITPVFRYERPQAGRLREHHQFGAEFYGADGAETDAEVILLAHNILTELGLQVELNINSMGCPTCRKKYNEALKAFLKDNFNNLCETCKVRYEKNPLRILDCKEEGCKKLLEGAPVITDYLCDDCLEHFNRLKMLLDYAQVPYKVNPFIVRGLDYYTRTVFEFITTSLGSQGTVCAGGRYNGLINELGGPDTPAVGFGMGLERIIMLMETLNCSFGEAEDIKLYIASMGEEAFKQAFSIAMELRHDGITAEYDHMQRSLKAQMRYADKIGAKYVIVIGDNEVASGKGMLQNMKDGSQMEIGLNRLDDFFILKYGIGE